MITIFEAPRRDWVLVALKLLIIISATTGCYLLAVITLDTATKEASFLNRYLTTADHSLAVWLAYGLLDLIIIIIAWRSMGVSKRPIPIPQSLLIDTTSSRLTHYYQGRTTELGFRYFRDFQISQSYLTLQFELTDNYLISVSIPRVKWNSDLEHALTQYREEHEILARLNAKDTARYAEKNFQAERIYRAVRYPGQSPGPTSEAPTSATEETHETAPTTDPANQPNHKIDSEYKVPKDHLPYLGLNNKS